MKKMVKKLNKKNAFVASMMLVTAMSANGDDFTDRTETAYVFGDYGLGTYKSLLVESNDTMGIVTYGLGTNAGQNKNLGIEYRVESQSVSFALSQSTFTSVWTSNIFKYRLWAFELGPVIGSVKMKATRAGTEIFDLVGSGYGGYFGMNLPVGKNSSLYFNGMSVSTGEALDKQQRVITVGSRLDLELGTRIAITRKSIDFVTGYRRRSNSITEGGASYNELQTSTFLGFNAGMDF